MAINPERLDVLKKIDEYEKQGLFDRDVENDPPTRPLKAGEVDYTYSRISTRIGAFFANRLGKAYFERRIRRGDYVIKEIIGEENFLEIASGGAFVTCNHFNAFDNYAVYRALSPMMRGRMLYKIIREGNYTSFGGFFGYLFRHCNTLPLSSSLSCLKELMAAVGELLSKGEKILIYPEQAMWYNYKKPRPLKVGAFRLAAKENAPVLPIFITLEDTDSLDGDGMPVQAYTIHILPPIYPDAGLGVRENSRRMCEKNYETWREVYEDFYGVKLEYSTEGEVDGCSI